MWRKIEESIYLMIFIDMKKPRIKYLELDENRYIENDEFKIRLNENNNEPEYITWDEMWDMVLADIDKLEKYEHQNSQSKNHN